MTCAVSTSIPCVTLGNEEDDDPRPLRKAKNKAISNIHTQYSDPWRAIQQPPQPHMEAVVELAFFHDHEDDVIGSPSPLPQSRLPSLGRNLFHLVTNPTRRTNVKVWKVHSFCLFSKITLFTFFALFSFFLSSLFSSLGKFELGKGLALKNETCLLLQRGERICGWR